MKIKILHFVLIRSLILATVLAVCSSLAYAQDRPDFSGTWIFSSYDAGNTAQAGPRSSTAGGDLDIIQDGNNLTVATSSKDNQGNDVRRELKYTLDFKPTVNTTPGFGGSQGTPARSYARWSEDGKTLRIVTVTVGNGTTKLTEEWSFVNKNTLSRTTINRAATGVERRTTTLYKRK